MTTAYIHRTRDDSATALTITLPFSHTSIDPPDEVAEMVRHVVDISMRMMTLHDLTPLSTDRLVSQESREEAIYVVTVPPSSFTLHYRMKHYAGHSGRVKTDRQGIHAWNSDSRFLRRLDSGRVVELIKDRVYWSVEILHES